MRKEAEAGREQWEGTKAFQMWAAGAASSWLRDRAGEQGWGACGQWEASPVVGFRCQGEVQRQLAVSTKLITETLRGMEMLGGGSGEAGLGRAEDRNQDLREGHCKVAQGGAAWQVGGIPRYMDLGLPGDDRSHLCRALCPVPGSQRGPGGSVPTWLSLESRTIVSPAIPRRRL